ncbi:MAG: ABC transporter substrate-binding protein [Myxococcales bacterium]|nr:ABC transporter substrate-binding protein [Myxococcales bacterium]
MVPPQAVVDALGRAVRPAETPRRIVSLVPSETLSVADLVGVDRLVGRTDYCIEPVGAIEAIASVGGTKGIDVDRVRALEPDLVLANQEENSRVQIEKLIDAGLTVHVSFPCTVRASIDYVRALGKLLGAATAAGAWATSAEDALRDLSEGGVSGQPSPWRVFAPIWRDPWMTFDGRTYASDVLRVCGAINVFEDRERRYPLAADVGQAPAQPTDRDTRYPRVTVEEIAARAPDTVLLADEPFRFGEDDRRALRALSLPAAERDRLWLVGGKDLFWYGTWTRHALRNLPGLLRDGPGG